MKVHLIDGTFELFRAFFGSPGATSPSGQEVGATRGILRSFNSLLRRDDVTHVACAFDTTIESFRNELFDGYKTGDGIDPELFAQFPLAERAAHALGIVVWSMIEFECDDALAAGAAKFAHVDGVEQVVLCTPDKDMAQCVTGERVVYWDRIRDRTFDQSGVIDKFGVLPKSIPDYLALVGDDADGIPGIPRWGAKSAGTVLSRYEHIDKIPEDPETWDVKVRGAKSLATELNPRREAAELYRTLATLRTDVPLKESLADLEWTGPRRDELQSLCDELGDARFLNAKAAP